MDIKKSTVQEDKTYNIYRDVLKKVEWLGSGTCIDGDFSYTAR